MGAKYDLLLKGGTVVDPANRSTEVADVAVANGKIVEIGEDLDPARSNESIEVKGKHVIPGILDLHVHASSWLGGRFGHKMMALAGVTTALDMSGPVESVLDIAREHGAGLNLASLQYVRPGHTVRDADPGGVELENLLQRSLRQGAYGFKILGGHYPLTPEATARAIEVARTHNAYLAFHAGSLETKSNIEGFHEAVKLAGDHAIHLAHINSYCRGRIRTDLLEAREAIEALERHPQICSESYLSPFNGTSAKCSGGVPESRVTEMCLTAGGFEATEAGLEEAIYAGWANINMESGGRVILASGGPAVDWWRQQLTDTSVSFPVNPDMPRLMLATAKRKTGEFAVDCISTDGGGIPRNVTVEMGLALVKLAALTIEEFVVKTSRNPALILGLPDKGHLGAGADADITVVDLACQKAILSLANGKMVMFKDYLCGRGTHIITTPAGAGFVKEKGLETVVVDLAQAQLFARSAAL